MEKRQNIYLGDFFFPLSLNFFFVFFLREGVQQKALQERIPAVVASSKNSGFSLDDAPNPLLFGSATELVVMPKSAQGAEISHSPNGFFS